MSRSSKSDRTATCPWCLTQNGESESFCRKCGAPVGAMTNLDPVQFIHTEGFLWRKVLEGRPKLIVLLGVWIMHLPLLIIGVGLTVYLLLNLSTPFYLVIILPMSALSYYAFVVLYRITKNYLTISKK